MDNLGSFSALSPSPLFSGVYFCAKIPNEEFIVASAPFWISKSSILEHTIVRLAPKIEIVGSLNYF